MIKETRITFFNRLIGKISADDIALVEFAYDLSKEAHRTQKRVQGGRYFEHPRAGCLILMDELNVYERDLIIAFLLHDVGEDTPLFGNTTGGYQQFIQTATFRISRIFGAKVADTVIRLTKPHVDADTPDFATKDAMMDYYLSELAESEDALVGKGIDRLHNLRSIPLHKHGWSEKQARETRKLLLPAFAKVQGPRKEIMEQLIEKIEAQLVTLEAVPA